MPLTVPIISITLFWFSASDAAFLGSSSQSLAPSLAKKGFLHSASAPPFGLTTLSDSIGFDVDENDEEEAEPGKMRVSEIKSELTLRGIDYTDCFDKESLVIRLEEARVTGKADPKILDDFNKNKLEATFKGEKVQIDDERIEDMVANDGTLPGGMSPDMVKKLVENPEVMTLLQSTKMQEAMKLMMTGGQEELEKAMQDDPEIREVVTKLNNVLGSELT